MKKTIILLLSIFSLATFSACNEEDDIRKNIDELNARLDALTDDLEGLNTSIRSFYEVANGLTFVTSYEMDEKGNYTFSLSDGTKLVVYGGQPEGDIPVIGISETGNWTYTLMGETKELTDETGIPISAIPADGKDGQTPRITIGEDGYWYYQLVGEEPQRIEGRYNIADITQIPASIFAGVAIDGNKITFSFGEAAKTDIYLLGGLDMTFASNVVSGTLVTTVTLVQGTAITLTAVQSNVKNIIIDPTPLQVKLSEDTNDNLVITAPVGLETGTYLVYFQIFSAEGYRLTKSLEVKVTSAGGGN